MALTAEALIQHLVTAFDLAGEEIQEDTKLLSSGLLDSFDVVTLVSFIESEAGFRVSEADVTLEHFDSVASMVAYIESKL